MKKYIPLFEHYEDDDLSDADEWLKNYTLNPWDKYPSDDIVEELLQSYPCDNHNVFLRGINFNSKEEYELFKLTTNMKQYPVDQICSFTLNKNTAIQYAKTKPMYLDMMDREDREDLQRRLKMQSNEAERYSGYKGIIIGVKANKSKVIDVNKSDFRKEDEYLLTKGTYDIVFLKPLSKFIDVINKGFDINKFIRKLTLNSLKGIKKDLLNYIIKHNLEITNDTKHHLYLKWSSELNLNDISHKIEQEYQSYDKIIDKVSIYFDSNIFRLIAFDYLFTADDKKHLKSTINTLCKKIYMYLKKNDLFKFPVYSKRNFEGFEKYGSEWLYKIKKEFNYKVGETYNKLNDKSNIDIINSLSGNEQRQAINDMMNSILNNFKNMV